jgi:hypothetical protein
VNNVGLIREALHAFIECVDEGERVAVPTLCLYPSNGTVTVYVTGGTRECIVSDGGGAIDEIAAHGLPVVDSPRLLKPFCKSRGLVVHAGQIMSPPVPIEAVAATIALVANASSGAAHWGVHKIKTPHRRDIRAALAQVLEGRFGKDRVLAEQHLTGQSTRRYRFDHIVMLGGDRRLLIDAVIPEASSVNAKAIAHIDLKQTEDPNLVQRVVYDEEDHWDAADLSLLQMAAGLVPFSMVQPNLDRIERNAAKQ